MIDSRRQREGKGAALQDTPAVDLIEGEAAQHV